MPKAVDVSSPHGPKNITMMTVGASRAGKTHFAATFPRPVFFSEATERGWTTIAHMDPELFYEKDFTPVVWKIEDPRDMMDNIITLESTLKKDPNAFWTVVIDSVTFYAEMKFTDLDRQSDAKDKRQTYGDLAAHMRYVMIQIHRLPINVVWISLAKEGTQDNSLGGLSILGQTAVKAPARCDIWAYMEQTGSKDHPEHRMHTRSYGGFKAGHRFGNMLDPMIVNPTYRDLEEQLQLQPWTERIKPKAAKPAKRRAKSA